MNMLELIHISSVLHYLRQKCLHVHTNKNVFQANQENLLTQVLDTNVVLLYFHHQ